MVSCFKSYLTLTAAVQCWIDLTNVDALEVDGSANAFEHGSAHFAWRGVLDVMCVVERRRVLIGRENNLLRHANHHVRYC